MKQDFARPSLSAKAILDDVSCEKHISRYCQGQQARRSLSAKSLMAAWLLVVFQQQLQLAARQSHWSRKESNRIGGGASNGGTATGSYADDGYRTSSAISHH
eukprot:811011-Pleurochrysis_carterae.AAC.2